MFADREKELHNQSKNRKLNSQRFLYLDILRLVACIFVVGVHVCAYKIYGLPRRGVDFAITWSADWLSLLGVPLFVMISGALVLRPEYKPSIKKIVIHKFLHYMVLFYFWKTLYQLYNISEPGFFSWEHFKQYVLLESGSHYHLWFLMMIAVLYLLLPVIKPAFEHNKALCTYFLVIYFVAILLIPELFHLIGKYGVVLLDYYEKLDLGYFGGYLGYFILGHYLATWGPAVQQERKKCLLIYIIGILSLLFVTFGGYVLCYTKNEVLDYLTTPLSATSFVAVTAIFVGVQNICSRLEANKLQETLIDNEESMPVCKNKVIKGKLSWRVILQEVNSATLGIYLLHPFVMERLGEAGISTSIASPILSIPFMVILLFLLCGIISWGIGKIPILRYFIKQ